jgi:hypothetical protein
LEVSPGFEAERRRLAADIDVVNLRGPHGPKEQLANISYSAAVRG